MNSSRPDYSKCTYEELIALREKIDEEFFQKAFPHRYKSLIEEIEKKKVQVESGNLSILHPQKPSGELDKKEDFGDKFAKFAGRTTKIALAMMFLGFFSIMFVPKTLIPLSEVVLFSGIALLTWPFAGVAIAMLFAGAKDKNIGLLLMSLLWVIPLTLPFVFGVGMVMKQMKLLIFGTP